MTLNEIDALNSYSIKVGRAVLIAVRKMYPEAYITPGLGWCGPDFEAAAELEKSLLAPHALYEGPEGFMALTALGRSVCAKAREAAAKRARASVYGAG